MSNNKQSSVDILCQKLANKLGLQAITFYIDHQEEIAEAKAMHKEEIINANFDGQRLHAKSVTNLMMEDNAEQYYNEIFNNAER